METAEIPVEKSGSDKEDSDDFFEDLDMSQPGLDQEKMNKVSSGVNNTPFIWDYHGNNFDMSFLSGFAGATRTEEGFVKGQMAWGILEKDQKKANK